MEEIDIFCIKDVFDDWLKRNLYVRGNIYKAREIGEYIDIDDGKEIRRFAGAYFVLEHFVNAKILPCQKCELFENQHDSDRREPGNCVTWLSRNRKCLIDNG